MFDNIFMEAALAQARLAYDKNEIPVGAVVAHNQTGSIISSAHNLVETASNATFHAEILAINQACELLNSKYLMDCSIYTTLEPCAMCAGAIAFAKLSRLYYAAPDEKQGAVEHNIRFFNSPSCFYHPQIYPGFCAHEAKTLIQKFFLERRK
jgi:tRNA(adenine34) deaminase